MPPVVGTPNILVDPGFLWIAPLGTAAPTNTVTGGKFTDAVAAGTMNLIAMTDKHADILGYVPAGVAVPVRTRAELLAALDAPSRPDAATRLAFLERHLRPGPAGPRIAAAIMAAIEENGIR